MKKKIIIIIPVILVLIVALFIFLNVNDNKTNNKNENITEKEDSNINITTNSFTLSNGKTEISIKIENLQDTDISINEMLIQLYNSSNEMITSHQEKIKATIKAKESTIIDLTLDKMYAETSEIKYKILN